MQRSSLLLRARAARVKVRGEGIMTRIKPAGAPAALAVPAAPAGMVVLRLYLLKEQRKAGSCCMSIVGHLLLLLLLLLDFLVVVSFSAAASCPTSSIPPSVVAPKPLSSL